MSKMFVPRDCKFPNCVGSPLLNSFSAIHSCFKFKRESIVSGIVPLSSLKEALRETSSVRLRILSVKNSPERSLLSRSNTTSDFMPPILTGMFELRKLSNKFRVWTNSSTDNSLGRGPSSLLLSAFTHKKTSNSHVSTHTHTHHEKKKKSTQSHNFTYQDLLPPQGYLPHTWHWTIHTRSHQAGPSLCFHSSHFLESNSRKW